jgi:hypothetical protein
LFSNNGALSNIVKYKVTRHNWGTEMGVPSTGVLGMRKWFTDRRASNGLKEFQSPQFIRVIKNTGVVAYIGRSVLLKAKLAECRKKDLAKMASYRRKSRVHRKPPLGVWTRNSESNPDTARIQK